MYRAVLLPKNQCDLHRFVWRGDSELPLKDYRMTRLTFGVCASSYATNMALKQNTLDHAEKYPIATKGVLGSFYVDDELTGADSEEEAKALQNQLRKLFSLGGFTFCKRKSSESNALSHIPPHLLAQQLTQEITFVDDFMSILGIRWNALSNMFHPIIPPLKPVELLAKRPLMSDLTKLYDTLGWCSSAVLKTKILMQGLWRNKLDWNEQVP